MLASSRTATPVLERVCCLLVLNSVTSTPQWIRQPEAAWLCVWCLCVWCLCVWCLCVVCARTFSGLSASVSLRTSGYASSSTLAFSLRLMPPRPAADPIFTHTGSSADLHPALLPFHGPISFTFLPRPDLHYCESTVFYHRAIHATRPHGLNRWIQLFSPHGLVACIG